MRDHRGEFSVEMMANILGVSKSGFYAWVSRPESGRVIDRRLLDVRVKACFEANHARYGSLKISRALAAQGHQYCRPRVADSMRRQGLRSKVQRKFVITTDTKHTLRVAPNLLDRMFDVETPNSVWVSDITYLPCRGGCIWLSLWIYTHGGSSDGVSAQASDTKQSSRPCHAPCIVAVPHRVC